jgi:hypothetical protein
MSDPIKQRIGVITNTYGNGRQWLLSEYLKRVPEREITIVDSNREIHTRNNVYIIITSELHACGLELNDYLIEPRYVSLEDYVKTRVRRRR